MWAIQGVDGKPTTVEVEPPNPQTGEILIEVAAAGVNRADTLQVAGHYPPPPGAPDTLGLEAAGVVVKVGAGLEEKSWLGRSVVALVPGGAQAQYCVARAELTLPLPVSGRLNGFIAGATLLEAAVTSWHNLVDLGFAPEAWTGHTVLIQGGSGAIGTIAVQLAKALGARVATTAGDESRRDKLRFLGADAVADYGDPEELLRIKKELTGGRGFDLILDVSGAGGLATNLELLAPHGRLNVIGLQKGTRAELDLGKLLAKSAAVQGSTIRGLDAEAKAALVQKVGENVWPLVEREAIHPVIAQTYTFSRVGRAHKDLLKTKSRPFGKLVLVTEEWKA